MIFSGGTPDFSRADLIATAPSFGAGTVRKDPLNYVLLVGKMAERLNALHALAVGVLDALMIYASCISFLAELVELKWRDT